MTYNVKADSKKELLKWVLELRTLAAKYAPKETGTLMNVILKSGFKIKESDGGFVIEINIDLPYAKIQHDAILRHLPNFQDISPRNKMASLIKLPTKYKQGSTREQQTHARRYSRGYYRARQYNMLTGPVKNPYFDRAIEEMEPALDQLFDGLITKMIKKYLD
jgi:hypothetical protein